MASLAGVVIFLFMSFGFSACGRLGGVEYSGFEDIGPEGWQPERCLEFSPWPLDSLRAVNTRYDVILCVRYSGRCRLKALPVEIETVSLQGSKPDTLQLSVPLYSAFGVRQGKGPYDVYEIMDTIARDFRLPQGYTVTLSNPLDAVSTRGITNLGIILSPSHH